MGDCIDLTLDSDEEAAPQTSLQVPAKRRLPSPLSDDSDVILVEDAAEAKRARQEPAEQQQPVDPDADVIVTAETGLVALRDLPHSRPDCGTKLFKKGVEADNSSICPQCYCVVCDKNAAECQFWGTGVRARDHCNAHSSSYWDALKKAARKGSRALLEKEYASTAPQLCTNWANNQGSEAGSKRSSTAGMVSPAVLWARAANAAVASSEALLRTPAGSASAAAAARSSVGSTPAPAAAGGLGSSAAPLATPAAALKAEVNQQTPATQTPQVPPASPWLQRMPHPSSVAPQMQHLATLELPVKLVKGLTIADVQRRLVPTGFYKGTSGRTPEFGEHLCLDNITNTRYVQSKRKEKADFLRLLPLVPPGGLPAAPSRQRTWKLLVVAHDGSARPQAVAVTVEHNCKLSALTSALRSKLGQSINLREALLLAQHEEVCDNWRWLRHDDLRMADSMLQHSSTQRYTYYVFRVPEHMLPRQEPQTATYMSYSQNKARMAILWHEKTLPLEEPEQQQQQQQEGRGQQRQREAWRRAMFYDSDDDSCDYGSEDPYDEDVIIQRIMGHRSAYSAARRAPQGVRFGLPQLVVIPELHLHGGDAADKAVLKDIIAQLSLFCRAGQQLSANAWPFELKRVSVKTSWQLSQDDSMRFAHRSSSELSSQWDSPGVAQLYAYWGTDPIAPPPGFDLDGFCAVPQVMDAEGIQQLAGMPKLLQDWTDYQHEMRLLNTLPGQVISELRTACSASPAPTDERDMHTRAHKPAAAAVLSIIPASSSSSAAAGSSSSAAAAAGTSSASSASSAVATAADAAAAMQGKKSKQHSSSRLGVLQIEVYVFRTSGRGHRLVAEDSNDWGAELTGRQARRGNYTSSCMLKSVMDARLLQEPAGYQLLRELDKLKHNDAHCMTRSIPALMEWVVTGERQPAQQPAGLNVRLHPYQLQSLAFMQEAEQLEGGWRQLLWRWLPPLPQQQQQQQEDAPDQQQQQGVVASVGEPGKGMWWSPVLDRLSFAVPPAPWGGFLAEEMGLGKTVEVLGLVLSNPAPPSVVPGTYHATGKIISRATLVVVAVSLVGQWCAEASSKLSGGLKMYPYHGSNRVRDPRKLATQYDLVVTTYATLGSDYGKNGSGTRNPLHQIKWHRVVFDEGHTVKNAAAGQSKACAAVAAERRWVCTGTPLNNDIMDLLGQFAVLHMQPMGTKAFFDTRIKPAFTGHGYGVSLVPLLYTLRHTMVRHTKAQTIAEVSVLALPEKTEELVPVVLSPAERRAYLDVHTKAAALWASVRHLRPAAINQKLLQIMALLLPLRRICSGGQLSAADVTLPSGLEAAAAVLNIGGTPAAAAAAAGLGVPGGMPGAAAAAGVAVPEDATIAVPEELECPICLDSFEAPAMTPCHHWFCKECILGVLSSNTHCPLCRGDLNPLALRAPGKNNQATPVLAKKSKSRTRRSSSSGDSDGSEDELEEAVQPDAAEGGRGSRRGSADPTDVLECESKLQALIAELTAMRAADPSIKALVFSQYNSTLEWLQRRLPQEGFSFRTITGSMAQRQRARAIEAFQSDPPTTVFLLSMRSGAVGINLTAASHVFLLEPCLNPALEEQAIGRAWRMGQQRKVTVKRFYVKGSIEERIMDVRRIRQGHAAAAPPAAAAAAAAVADDQAGSSAAAAAAGTTPATPAAAAAAADRPGDPVAARNKQRAEEAVLVGNLTADRQELKIAELDLLFRTPELEGHNGDGGSGAAAAAAAAGTSAAAAAAAAAAGADEAQDMEL